MISHNFYRSKFLYKLIAHKRIWSEAGDFTYYEIDSSKARAAILICTKAFKWSVFWIGQIWDYTQQKQSLIMEKKGNTYFPNPDLGHDRIAILFIAHPNPSLLFIFSPILTYKNGLSLSWHSVVISLFGWQWVIFIFYMNLTLYTMSFQNCCE